VAGTVLDDVLAVACGEGAVRLVRLQRAGRPAMDAGDLLRGWSLPAGTVLG
jgi:methionyl-tRNA formyltransferase